MPYTIIGGRHRPYLETLFGNPSAKKISTKTFAMIDSGADHTVIPFSIGTSIGLPQPTEQERLEQVSGVGGNLSYIQRDCRIHIVNPSSNEISGFDETVWWIYPDAEMQNEQTKLIDEYKQHQEMQNQCIPNTNLHAYFAGQMQRIIESLSKIQNRLETGVLLGRPFFSNFEFIKFCHKDRENEDKCFFEYEIIPDKLKDLIRDQAIINKVETTS